MLRFCPKLKKYEMYIFFFPLKEVYIRQADGDRQILSWIYLSMALFSPVLLILLYSFFLRTILMSLSQRHDTYCFNKKKYIYTILQVKRPVTGHQVYKAGRPVIVC